ncbi:MAG TPA: thioredoxin fold domain-containing protein [Spirochaetota bacterium]|jgi:thioredoxin-related protein|nr:thioredoxin fold domain-containing protein [Spirochaetota bacterium]HOK92640.1 thioredoxin fold domain-containing protein [Spirochaetota bacterium]HON15331.1 thioredoxin fold domain-containing protein [Spirochaetota bacterium]HPP95115.1 thioredoxin fold domain-containing protein [Spirochaetota bacterium]
MLKKTLLLTFIFIAFSCSNSTPSGSNKNAGAVKWYGVQEGMDLAKKEGKGVIMFFYTDWCIYCKMMDAEVFSDVMISSFMNENFINIKINPEKSRETISVMGQSFTPMNFMGEIGATGFPTTMFWNKNQKPLTVLPGYTDKDRFLSVLKYIKDDCFTKKISLEEYMTDTSKCLK